MSDATRRTALAERAARAGGVVAREAFRGTLAVDQKRDAVDLVTDADREAQQQVISTIRQEFPGDGILAEEEGGDVVPGEDEPVNVVEDVGTGDVWVIDPIDGTANFVRGIRFFTTTVAAMVGGDPAGVATFFPADGDLYAAGPESVTLNGNAITVSDRTNPAACGVGLLGRWPQGGGDGHAALYAAMAERFGDVRRFGSMQGELALVASGGLDGAFSPEQPHLWDSIAGVHLVRRAGGRATDLDGEPWTRDSDGLVVSNGHIHDELLSAVREAGFGTATE